ncbi:MAG: Smr/MutS family protein [Bacteroidales bacterium]|nr:Smr/MutS family protein [Bacteroidales bacterium]
MLIPDNIEAKLRFGKVRLAVEQECLTPIGRDIIRDMAFRTEYEEICRLTGETAELQSILNNSSDFPAETVEDLQGALTRIKIEGTYMTETELASLRTLLDVTERLTRFFGGETSAESYPYLSELAQRLVAFPLTARRIDEILDDNGEVKDSASPELSRLRSEIRNLEASVSRRMLSILHKAQSDGIVDAEASVSVRDGLAVIPVAAANKRQIQGIVVSESATGRTAFVQPAEIVALNGKIVSLRGEERREVVRILKDVASNIRPYSEEIKEDCVVTGQFDSIRAKAVYANAIGAILPTIENRQGMYVRGARHPILQQQLAAQGRQIVPLNIELESPQCRLLVISGPNAGGKSVCLQTVGIIQMMLQMGLLVPVAEGSKMGIFENIFIDIGDDQSIENDLSTYSSHLTAMKSFVRNANGRTLLLIDEFGTGTEPMLGGAIAESVLEDLNNKKAFGVVTTHYTNLKHFASSTAGLQNAAMAFDTQRIEPKFSLHIGQPGSSFAFEIARKIGLPENILQSAKEKIGQENADYDKNLRQIVRDKHYWEQKRQSVKENDKHLGEVLEKYEKQLDDIKTERKEILRKAKEEAQRLLDEANKQIEHTIREIREAQAEKNRTKEVRQELQELKERVSEGEDRDDTDIDEKMNRIRERQKRRKERQEKKREEGGTAPAQEKPKEQKPIEVGDTVCIDKDKKQSGKVIAIMGANAQIQIGQMTTIVKIARLSQSSAVSKSTASPTPQQTNSVNYSHISDGIRERKLQFSPEIDVRGMRADEAIERTARFVDEAILCDSPLLRILHGKGNGILRSQIRQFLKSLPYVVSVHDEAEQFGGAGITIVEL